MALLNCFKIAGTEIPRLPPCLQFDMHEYKQYHGFNKGI